MRLTKMKPPITNPWLPAILLAATMATQADPGQITVATELKSSPDAGASTISQLTAGQAIQIGPRQGAWYQIKAPQGEGWVRMLNVRLQGTGSARSESAMSGIAAIGQASRSNTTVATGVRGLSRENLQSAQENPQEVARLAQYQVSAAEARQFGQAGGLPAAGR